MKKSIKFAGVTAAALLAVAPIAAPVLANTTTVNAEVKTDWTEEEIAQQKALYENPATKADADAYWNQFQDKAFTFVGTDKPDFSDVDITDDWGTLAPSYPNDSGSTAIPINDSLIRQSIVNKADYLSNTFFLSQYSSVTSVQAYAIKNGVADTANPLTFNEIKDILTNKKDDGVQYVFGYKYKTDANGDFIRGTKTINFTYADGSDTNTDSDFTEKDGHGVVVAKGDKNFYFLVNDDNVQSATRGVAKNSGWQFDKTRTDKDGNVQYRVSGHEWINAADVTVQSDDTDNTTTNPDGLTVTKLANNKVINLSTPGTVYFLYNKDGVRSDVRSLAGGSAWQIDKTATDAAGNTYYGVSTNEFVKAGEGVSLAN